MPKADRNCHQTTLVPSLAYRRRQGDSHRRYRKSDFPHPPINLRNNSSDTQEFGHIIRDHMAQLHSTYGTTYLVADSALYSEDHLALLQDTPTKWSTRVPGTWNEVKAALAQANPE
jgi:hypothetical protein